MWMKIRQRIMG